MDKLIICRVCGFVVLTEESIFQKVTSEWQRDVHKILIRTSHDLGGSNSTSSMTRGSPDFLHIAAVPFHEQLSN
jgi:hypothetical protein